MGYLKAFLAAIGPFFSFLNKWSGLANSSEMKKHKAAQTEQESIDKGQVDIAGAAKGDEQKLKELRQDLSE